jgi:hypothetical protein
MLDRPLFILLLASFFLPPSSVAAEDNQYCSDDPLRCAHYTPLLYKEFSQRAVDALSKVDPKDCKSKTWSNAQSVAGSLVIVAREGANGYAAFVKKYPTQSSTTALALAKELGEAMHDAWDMSAAVKVEIGDKALKSGCIEIAEEEYRYVLARYTAAEQQGYQRRAAVGLEDIRSKKGTVMCSWFGRC